MKASSQTTTFIYDTMGWVDTQTDSLGSIVFAYDDNGNPLTVTEGSAILSRTFDNMDRVESYTDAAGNTVEYEWDKNGNLTKLIYPDDREVTYTYDAHNRLTGVGGVTYTYDSENNRIPQTTSDGTTTYVFDPHGDALPRVLVREQPDEALTYYVYGIGLLYEVDEADDATYYHFDQSGSTIALTDGAGAVTDRIEYTPYGTASHRSGETDTPFLYAGQFGIQTDPDGLLHMRARYYSPELKRFVNADPAGFGGGLNWYAYANNSPLMYVDPDGEVAVLVVVAAFVVGGMVDVGINATIAAISGQSYSWSNAGRDFLIGGTFGAATGGIGTALRVGIRGARTLPSINRILQRREFAQYRNLGFSAKQAHYLTQPYPSSGMGHHFIPRKTNISKSVVNSPLNIMGQGQGLSRGQFYRQHALSDPSYSGGGFPNSIGGTWSAKNVSWNTRPQPIRTLNAAPEWLSHGSAFGKIGGSIGSFK